MHWLWIASWCSLTFVLVLGVNRIAAVVNAVMLKDGTLYGTCIVIVSFSRFDPILTAISGK